MRKIQEVHFETVDDFLDYLPENERQIVDFLRDLIFDCMPDCTERLAYNVPYYYRHSRVFFIWPPAVPWGKFHPKGVQLGFCNGYLLQDEINYLEKSDRKQVYIKTFLDSREIDMDLLRAYLFAAVEVDEQLKRNKRGRKG